jgi:REP element-mobilizing transposase RayT
LAFRSWGGKREGAGRKPKGKRAMVPHAKRAELASRYPVHVTVKVREGLPTLRRKGTYAVVRGAFAKGCERFGFRLVQYSVQRDHLHLIAEAKDRTALSRGMQGLLIRVAKALNKCWGRKGSVFGDHYFDRVLRTPREVRNALSYVLHNARKHGLRIAQGLDHFASGWWFDGWRDSFEAAGLEGVATPVARARTWLLTKGWRKHRLLSLDEVPVSAST